MPTGTSKGSIGSDSKNISFPLFMNDIKQGPSNYQCSPCRCAMPAWDRPSASLAFASPWVRSRGLHVRSQAILLFGCEVSSRVARLQLIEGKRHSHRLITSLITDTSVSNCRADRWVLLGLLVPQKGLKWGADRTDNFPWSEFRRWSRLRKERK